MSDRPKPIVPENIEGTAPLLLICDHASAEIPERFAQLGLGEGVRMSHAVWDPGAIRLARWLAMLLSAPLIGANVSRLVVDTNRAPDAPDLIPETADGAPVPGNLHLREVDRGTRLVQFHEPFHAAIDNFLDSRSSIAALVSIHTFEPVLNGKARPWHAGIIFDPHRPALGERVAETLEGEAGVVVGRNQPYAPADGVYYTLDRHSRPRGLQSAMIEVRNDLLSDQPDIDAWGERLARAVHHALRVSREGMREHRESAAAGGERAS